MTEETESRRLARYPKHGQRSGSCGNPPGDVTGATARTSLKNHTRLFCGWLLFRIKQNQTDPEPRGRSGLHRFG